MELMRWQYGRVERLYIEEKSRKVFIKFTNQVSALRVSFLLHSLCDFTRSYPPKAVNELDGRVFNGNTIVPRFFDTEKFEKGIYS